jgi:hypothetical protein
MKKDKVIAEFKRGMCRFHGYDENRAGDHGPERAASYSWRRAVMGSILVARRAGA